jgi:hypothetical protein
MPRWKDIQLFVMRISQHGQPRRVHLIGIGSSSFLNGATVGAAILLGTVGAFAFGTVNMLGQHAEHEKVTRTALGCKSNNSIFTKEDLCFQDKSLDEISGKTGTFGAVGAPDNPVNNEGNRPEAHCDNSKLLECRSYIHEQIEAAVAASHDLLHWNSVSPNSNGSIDNLEIPTFITCTYFRRKGRAKCNVIEHLGSALHAAQDFYSHSNWADEAASGQTTISNPIGLNKSEIAPILNLRLATTIVPNGLISGCFISEGPSDLIGNAKCKVPSHKDLNKDLGIIEPVLFNQPGDPTLTTATTTRGKIGTNFHKAVAGAVLDTQDKIRYFKERLIEVYGNKESALMLCAITHDEPSKTCP